MGFRTQFRGTKEWLETTGQSIKLETPSEKAAEYYDAAVTQLCGWYDDDTLGGLGKTVELMREADPNFKLGKILEFELDLMGSIISKETNKTFSERLAELKNQYEKEKFANRHEELHYQVVTDWAMGDIERAYLKLEKLITHYPEDVAALKMLQDMYFMRGTALPMRNSLAYAMAKVSDKNPLKGYAHGMFSFALEESNMYAQCEAEVVKALELIPFDTWAIHNHAHSKLMQGKAEEGLKWMQDKKCDWEVCQMLACHQYWHTALFHIDNNQFDEAVDLLDHEVLTRCNNSCTGLDLVDGASMVYRMELVDLFSKVKKEPKTNTRDDSLRRWKGIYDICKPHVEEHSWGFNDAHYMMSYLGMGDTKSVDTILNTISQSTLLPQPATTECLLNCMRLFSSGEYKRCVDHLEEIRFDIIKLGGSHAQRDIFEQILLVAALRSPDEDHNKLGQRMILERDIFYGRRLPLTELLAQQASKK